MAVARVGLLAAALLVCLPARAAEPKPLWEVGLGGIAVSQQAYPGADEHVDRWLALPYFIYRGPVLRAERGSVGLRAVNTDRYEVDVGFSAAFGSRSSDVAARAGMPDLGTLVEFGPRVKWKLGEGPGGSHWRASLPLRGVFDISHGFAYKGLSLEPEIALEDRSAGNWTWDVKLSAIFGNASLANTFYAVPDAYVTATRSGYDARAGFITTRLGINLSRRVTPDLRLLTFLRVDSVAGATNEDSPLVRRTTGATVGVGVLWTFMRSPEMARD